MIIMAKSSYPLKYQLRVLASKIERDLLDHEEKKALALLFRRIAEGENFDEIFGVKRSANRPKGDAIEHRVYEVEMMRLPKNQGGDGLNKRDAIKEVAMLRSVAVSTIESDLKSERAKAIRQMVKDSMNIPIPIKPFRLGG